MTFGNRMTAGRTKMPSPDILDLVLHKVAIEVYSEFGKKINISNYTVYGVALVLNVPYFSADLTGN